MDGYDGIIIQSGDGDGRYGLDESEKMPKWVITLEPTQIKSATGNSGKFDPDSGDITKTAPSPKQSRKKSARKPAKGGTMRRKKGS